MNFQLSKIQEITYEIQDITYVTEKPLQEDKLEFESHFNINIEENFINLFIHFRYIYPAKKRGKKFHSILHSDLSFKFKVDKIDEILKKDNKLGKYLPTSFVSILASVSFSTSRGFLFERTKGTFMNNILLPIIMPDEYVESHEDNVRGNKFYIDSIED